MKFRYRNEDEMKDSDIEWIGKIPKHWNSIMFKRVIQRVNNGIWGDDAKSNSDDIPCIRVLNFNRNTMEVKIDNLTIRNIPRIKQKGYLLKKGDLLIEKSGGGEKSPVGFVVRYNYELPAVYANFMAKISLNNNTISEYIKYLCSAIYNRKLHLDSINQTTGIQNLDSEIYFKRYIALPNVLEQEKIAKFLDEKTAEFDSIISKKEALIEKLEEAKKSLISEVVTGKVKVIKTSDGYELVERKQEEMKDSGVEWLGDIPRDWKVKRLRFLGNLQNGISKSSEEFGHGYPFISYGDVYKNIKLPKKASGLVNSTLNDQKIYSVLEGDVFFTRTSETIEEIGIASTCLDTIPEATFAGFLIRFRPKKDNLYKEFSKYYFRCELNRSFFVKEMNLVTRASLSQTLLKNLSVLIPSFDEQVKIAECLDYKIGTIDKLIKINSNQILKLKKAKQSLISEAVTGKIEILE